MCPEVVLDFTLGEVSISVLVSAFKDPLCPRKSGGGIKVLGFVCLGLGGEPCSLVENGVSLHGLGVRVDLEKCAEVVQRVLLLASSTGSKTSLSDDRLDFIRVDDTRNVGVTHDWLRQGVSLLRLGGLSEGAEDRVELVKGTLREDAEPSQVATRGELEEVERLDVGDVNAWQVTEALEDAVILGVNDERSSTDDVPSVSELAFACTELFGRPRLFDIVVSTNGGEKRDGVLGLADRFNGVIDDARYLGDLRDSVATGHHEGWEGRGSEGRHSGVSPLVDVDLTVPSTPDLGWGEHTSTSAHVTEGTLAGPRGTATWDTRDTCDGTAGAPRLGRGFHTRLLVDGVRLTLVLRHVHVNKLHNIRTDWCGEHGRENGGGSSLASGGQYSNLRESESEREGKKSRKGWWGREEKGLSFKVHCSRHPCWLLLTCVHLNSSRVNRCKLLQISVGLDLNEYNINCKKRKAKAKACESTCECVFFRQQKMVKPLRAHTN